MTKDAGEYLVTQAATRPTNDAGQDGGNNSDILVVARQQVLQRGEGLNQDQVLAVLQLPDDRLEELLALAHEVRMRWCGPEVEVEGIISLKTGGCPEDCHFCSQSGLFASRCAAPGWTYPAWSRRPNRPPSPAPPSSASWPRCADPTSD